MPDTGASAAISVTATGQSAVLSGAYGATASLLGVSLDLGVTGLSALAVGTGLVPAVRPGAVWIGESAAAVV